MDKETVSPPGFGAGAVFTLGAESPAGGAGRFGILAVVVLLTSSPETM